MPYSSEFEPLPEDRLSELQENVALASYDGPQILLFKSSSTRNSTVNLNIPGYTAKKLKYHP
jgi:hypothetical protein